MEVALVSKHWFLPKNPDLLGLLCEQAAITVDGMHALVAWAAGEPAAGDDVREYEHHADDKKRQLWRELREAFSPPIDAEDLYSLSSDLDEVLNASKNLVRELEVMELTPDTATHEMTLVLAEATQHLADACARLGKQEGDATECADAAIKSTRRVEHVYRSAMSTLLQIDDLREIMGRREVYRRLSRIADHIRAVAERVWYAVMKEG
jgi:uncharacterized protein Yka (UPF0111/DUF47 family)